MLKCVMGVDLRGAGSDQLEKAKNIYHTKGLDQVFLDIPASSIAPSDGKWDFSVLDQQISLMPKNMELKIQISGGLEAPSWLIDDFLPFIELSLPLKAGGKNEKVKVVRVDNPQYLEWLVSSHAAMKQHLTNTGQMGNVTYISGNLFNGLPGELLIPCNGGNQENADNADAYLTAGYTAAAAQSNFNDALMSLAQVFIEEILTFTPHSPIFAFPWTSEDNGKGSEALMNNIMADSYALLDVDVDGGGAPEVVFDALSTVGIPNFYLGLQAAGWELSCQTNAWHDGGGACTGPHDAPIPPSAAGLQQIIAAAKAAGCVRIEFHPESVANYPEVIAQAT